MTAVAIVTGSGTGIGAAIALRLAGRGWAVAINYSRSEAAAAETARECEAAGGETLLCQADVSIEADCARLVEATRSRWGRVDALVNNAGTTKFVPMADLDGLSRDDFERIFAVNVFGAFTMTQKAAPALAESGRGAIVNVSSYSGTSGIGSSLAYAASKGALNTLTKGLALALAPRIRVNAVCPGYVDTRWARGALDDATYERFKTRFAAEMPLQIMPVPADVADAAVWFVDGAWAVTGQLLVIDAGEHMAGGISISDVD